MARMEWSTPRRPARLPAGFIARTDGASVYSRGAALIGATGIRQSQSPCSCFVRSATIDGEAVYCGKDGLSDLDKLHSLARNADAFLFAFDLLELKSYEELAASLSGIALDLGDRLRILTDAEAREMGLIWRGAGGCRLLIWEGSKAEQPRDA
jgi:hypothetical protein